MRGYGETTLAALQTQLQWLVGKDYRGLTDREIRVHVRSKLKDMDLILEDLEYLDEQQDIAIGTAILEDALKSSK